MWEWKNFLEFTWIYLNLLEFTWIYLFCCPQSSISAIFEKRVTNGPTDWRTDLWTDKGSYRDAWTHLKMRFRHYIFRRDLWPVSIWNELNSTLSWVYTHRHHYHGAWAWDLFLKIEKHTLHILGDPITSDKTPEPIPPCYSSFKHKFLSFIFLCFLLCF